MPFLHPFRKVLLMKLISSLAAVSLASLISATASASVSVHNYVPCESTEGFGSFLATVTYTYTSGTTAGVSVVLNNNTTPVSSGGYITGLLLNVNATGISFVSCTNANFMNTGPASGAPYGSFMGGAALAGNWLKPERWHCHWFFSHIYFQYVGDGCRAFSNFCR